MNCRDDQVITRAYHYLKRGYALPLDLIMELFANDICPGDLEDMVDEGYDLDECLDMLCFYPTNNEMENE